MKGYRTDQAIKDVLVEQCPRRAGVPRAFAAAAAAADPRGRGTEAKLHFVTGIGIHGKGIH